MIQKRHEPHPTARVRSRFKPLSRYSLRSRLLRDGYQSCKFSFATYYGGMRLFDLCFPLGLPLSMRVAIEYEVTMAVRIGAR